MKHPQPKPGARVGFGNFLSKSSYQYARVLIKVKPRALGPGELARIAYYRERHPRLRIIDGGRS